MDRPTMGTDEVNVDDVARNRSGDAPTGVRRVNNMPLVIIGAVLAVFVVLVTLVALQRGGKKEAEPVEAAASLPENSQILDQMLAHGGEGGLVPDPDEGVVAPSFQVARVEDEDLPPLPSDSSDSIDSAEGREASGGRTHEALSERRCAPAPVSPQRPSATPGGQTAPPAREAAVRKNTTMLRVSDPRRRSTKRPCSRGGIVREFDRRLPGLAERLTGSLETRLIRRSPAYAI